MTTRNAPAGDLPMRPAALDAVMKTELANVGPQQRRVGVVIRKATVAAGTAPRAAAVKRAARVEKRGRPQACLDASRSR